MSDELETPAPDSALSRTQGLQAVVQPLAPVGQRRPGRRPAMAKRAVRSDGAALAQWARALELRVAEQAKQIEALSRLKQFFSAPLADLIIAGGAADPLRSHRREIVVVFLDLRGFTAFADSADPEDVMAVLREYQAAMGPLIQAHQGTLERFAGDGMMIFFNDPLPLQRPAEHAARMALAMQASMRALQARWSKLGFELDLGIGIAQGYATLGAVGYEGRYDYAAIGTVTNLASRLCEHVAGGSILVSQRAAAALEEIFALRPVAPLLLPGFNKPVRAWELRCAQSTRTDAETSRCATSAQTMSISAA